MKVNIEQTIRSGYAAAFMLLLFSYGLLYYVSNRNKAMTELVMHSNMVIHKMTAVYSGIQDAETGFRGFLITNDSRFLDPYYKGKKEFAMAYDSLRRLTTDNSDLQRQLTSLQFFAKEKFALMSEAMSIYMRTGNITDSIRNLSYHGKAVTERITGLINQMEQTESKLLGQRKTDLDMIYNSIQIITTVSLVVAFILIGYSVITFNRENKAKKIADSHAVAYQLQLEERIKELNEKNVELSELRNIEKFAATGRIARTMAHEVKNPLNNINLATEQLKDIAYKIGDDAIMLDIINRNTDRINRLITELLNSTGLTELTFEATSVNELLDEALEMAADRIDLRNIKVIKKYSNDICNVSVDKAKMKIAFLNIIVNAIEAMEKKKESILEIETAAKNDRCVVTITDNGDGMDDATVSKLFEPYFTSKTKGTGLGLTNTQNIILNHKGAIHVRSIPDGGTSFIITLSFAKEFGKY